MHTKSNKQTNPTWHIDPSSDQKEKQPLGFPFPIHLLSRMNSKPCYMFYGVQSDMFYCIYLLV